MSADQSFDVAAETGSVEDFAETEDLESTPLPPTMLAKKLTAAQMAVCVSAFQKFASSDDSILAENVERAIVFLFPNGVSDEALNAVMDATEGRDAIDFAGFLQIVVDLLSKSTQWGQLKTSTSGHVGFDTITEQVQRKMMKDGYEFNMLVVGQSGLGKSTLVDSLFQSTVSAATSLDSDLVHRASSAGRTSSIQSVSHVLEENGVRLKLTITDTPGFGDSINNSNCWEQILNHIEAQYSTYLDMELTVDRPTRIPDTRVHVCLYFIPPTGHGLRPLDVACMSVLHQQVNLVPVIAKSDTLTVSEREAFKSRIREDLLQAGIKTYPPANRSNLTAEEVDLMTAVEDMVPYAIVGGNAEVTRDGTTIRGRKTKFGFVELENPRHCEFAALRDMLIRTNMQDLKEVTANIHYENYRRHNLDPPVEPNLDVTTGGSMA